jgi:hypothetical protein
MADKPRRTIAEIVRELVHAGNHVDLKDDADALVTSEKPAETEEDTDAQES